MDVLWVILIALGLALLAWYAFAVDPHWVARDGKAFTCRVQYLTASLAPEGRWRDAKAFVDGGMLVLRPRGGLARTPRAPTRCTVLRRGESPPRGRITYVVSAEGDGLLAVIRIPIKSRAATHVDSLISG